jgi:hypothetical protein
MNATVEQNHKIIYMALIIYYNTISTEMLNVVTVEAVIIYSFSGNRNFLRLLMALFIHVKIEYAHHSTSHDSEVTAAFV